MGGAYGDVGGVGNHGNEDGKGPVTMATGGGRRAVTMEMCGRGLVACGRSLLRCERSLIGHHWVVGGRNQGDAWAGLSALWAGPKRPTRDWADPVTMTSSGGRVPSPRQRSVWAGPSSARVGGRCGYHGDARGGEGGGTGSGRLHGDARALPAPAADGDDVIPPSSGPAPRRLPLAARSAAAASHWPLAPPASPLPPGEKAGLSPGPASARALIGYRRRPSALS